MTAIASYTTGMRPDDGAGLSWLGILRCGLVQTALGAIVVLTTSTLNRVMVVELALPAMLPGLLVGLHYAVQLSRPRWGYGSDKGGRRTPWIQGGMAVLALGGVLAALATAWMASATWAGIALATVAFAMIGAGVGAAGTSLLAFLATRVREQRRAAAATIVWLMMIAGMIITATISGGLLDPFTPARLVAVTGGVAALAMLLSLVALWGVEARSQDLAAARALAEGADRNAPHPRFRTVMAEIWAEPAARRFSIFVFVSMLAYSAQDLILEPFAGHVFGMTPGESTKLAGLQHSGVLVGMIAVAIAGGGLLGARLSSLKLWTVTGCLGSAAALAGIVAAGQGGDPAVLKLTVLALGFANGAFAVAAIGSMMRLAGQGKARREGVRMGLWGAAQAIAFGLGGFLGAAAADALRAILDDPALAYGSVFAGEGVLFVIAAAIALTVETPARAPEARPALGSTGPLAAE